MTFVCYFQCDTCRARHSSPMDGPPFAYAGPDKHICPACEEARNASSMKQLFDKFREELKKAKV